MRMCFVWLWEEIIVYVHDDYDNDMVRKFVWWQYFCSMLGLKALWCLCYYNITRWIDIFDENILCDAENDDSWFDENDALCDDMKKRWLIRMFAWWQCK